MKETMGCTTWMLLAIGLIILGPVLYYFGGWIAGHILAWLIGDTVVKGFNFRYNTT